MFNLINFWKKIKTELNFSYLLWPPCIADAGILFYPCGYFFLSFFFFSCLFSAVADCMSTMLPHMLWTLCKFRLQVKNVLHVAHTKITQKNRHPRTITQLCWAISLQLRHVSTIGKKLVKQQYLLHMYIGPLTAEISWWLLGTPANFSGFRILVSLLHSHDSAEVNQNLHDVWLSFRLVHYAYIFRVLLPNRIVPCAKFILCSSLALSYISSITARYSSSGHQP